MKHIVFALGFLAALFSGDASAQWQTSSLPYPPGTTYYYVSKTAGDNANDGSAHAPWKDLSFAYEEMFRDVVNTTGDPYAPAALIVEPGYYGPSNGEQFPIQMYANKFIGGMDAHTTIVSLERSTSATSVFNFIGRHFASGVPDARFGPFNRDDGPYLERLTLRDSLAMDASNIVPAGNKRALEMNGQVWDPLQGLYVGDCKIVQPTVTQLVIYGFDIGVLANPAEPRIVDCTIVMNQLGIHGTGNTCTPPCTATEVINCIVNGNTTDIRNVEGANVVNTNFTTVSAGNPCLLPSVIPSLPVLGGPTQNPAIPFGSLKFVNTHPAVLTPMSLEQEFDFRLRADSPLRKLGRWTWADPLRPLWDGEGFANLRMQTTTVDQSDIGADQFNSFRMEPLFRVFDHNITIQSVAAGWPNQPGNTTLVDLVVTPVSVSAPTVMAYPLVQDPALSTSYLPIPLLDPLSFDGILAISHTVLSPTVVANTTPQTATKLPISVPAGFPLVMQVAFVETLPSGATHISLSNGQRIPAMP